MTFSVFIIVLFAAFLHALWNAIVKNGSNTLLTTIIITMMGSIIAVVLLPFCKSPEPVSFIYIGISVILQVLYFFLISYIYQRCDMGTAYPLMRGSAPLITAVIGSAFLGEIMSMKAWLGILFISGGIISMVFFNNNAEHNKNWLALLNAVVIATYTIIDGIGVRLSFAPLAYILWIMLFQGIILTGIQCIREKNALLSYLQQYWHLGVIGGIGMMGSYGLALWAMTVAPIVLVAALRETSILFALIISVLILKEKITNAKRISALFIFCGVIMMKF